MFAGQNMFFENLQRYNEQIALIDASSATSISYQQLAVKVDEFVETLNADKNTTGKELVFIESRNSITSVICYLACLKANKTVYLLENLTEHMTVALINLYHPHILINAAGDIQRHSNRYYPLHRDLMLLLSTSGSTGTPKFVKLSAMNIQSNAESIAEYLQLTASDIALAHLKLHYSYGLSILHSHLQVGACIVFTDYSVKDDGFWHDLQRYSATSFAGVPYTFETLLKTRFDFQHYPSLRYVTQAGGKLEPHLVKQYALQAMANGVDFIVMYGQTEAAPRISYLPPELASQFPGTIGHAIPHGELFIVDNQGETILTHDEPGELAYRGANVMMGYAEQLADLAKNETPSVLLTGDIACRTEHDLFYIVGRTKRFVKLFGLRINLDDVQSFVKTYHPHSAVTGSDSGIIVALEMHTDTGCTNSSAHDMTCDKLAIQEMLGALSASYALPRDSFEITILESIPLLASGKYDLNMIANQVERPTAQYFITRALAKMADILELNEKEWDSIMQLFSATLGLDEVDPNACLDSLNSDSLSFVYLSTELEQCLGDALPVHWQQCSVTELNTIYNRVRLYD